MIQEAGALPNPAEVRIAVLSSRSGPLAYFLGSILNLGIEEEQKMLEANTADELLRLAHNNLARELEILQLRSKIATEAQTRWTRRSAITSCASRCAPFKESSATRLASAEAQLLRERLEKAELRTMCAPKPSVS